MRSIGAGFGLLAFLIAMAITMWMWGTYHKEVAHYGVRATKEAQQIAGQDEHGRLAINSLTLAPKVQNGKLKYVLVDTINPTGAYAKWFHLQQNDAIIGVGPIDLRDPSMGIDEEYARALIQEAYQKKQELIVMREGQKISLPEGTVLGGTVSLAEMPKPTTRPTTKPSEERVLRKELGPIEGLFK